MEEQLSPKVIYVSPEGSDMNDGSKEYPFASIQKAADSVVPGSTVHVAPGNYMESVKITTSGEKLSEIIFVSDKKWAAKILPQDDKPPMTMNGDYVIVEGFELSGHGIHGILVGGSHSIIKGNHVYGMAPDSSQCTSNGGAGIVTYSEGYLVNDVEITGNVVHDIGPQTYCNFIQGIYMATDNNRVFNNIVYNISGWGIHGWHAVSNAIVANNLVFGCRRGGIVLGAGDAPGGVITDNCIVTNNIIMNNIGCGVIEMGETGTNNKYKHNLVYGNTSKPFSLQNGNIDKYTIEADPQFVNFKPDGSGDYHLKEGSPCINAGTVQGAPAEDIDGVLRMQEKAMDIGPYESNPDTL